MHWDWIKPIAPRRLSVSCKTPLNFVAASFGPSAGGCVGYGAATNAHPPAASNSTLDIVQLMDSKSSASMDDIEVNRQHMAAQACETCRARKVKCDEERPRCGVCQRLNVGCEYREAKPTKKDKTLVYILDALKSLEGKIDRLLSQGTPISSSAALRYSSMTGQLRQQAIEFESERDDPVSIRPLIRANSEESSLAATPKAPSVPHNHQIEARKLLAWPAVHSLLQHELVQIPHWEGENDGGEKWFTKISRECQSLLPIDEPVNFMFIAGDNSPLWETRAVCLTKSMIEDLCQVFFLSFHATYPILDRRHFYAVTLPQAYRSSFDQHDGSSAVVLLVLALGAVAQEGVSGNPILESPTGRRTGIRGGTSQRPPGLAFLTEAKKRIGLMMAQYDLETLQCFILFAAYYSQCSRNLDCWNMITLSGSICQSLVRTVDDWRTFPSDMVARSYWMCVLLEGGLTGELGLTPTRITDLENSVPLPLFLSDSLQEKSNADEDLFIEYQFLAQITLRALLNRINTSVCYFANPYQPEGSNETPPKTLILELSSQLNTWRAHLPSNLYWDDEDLAYGIGLPTTQASWPFTVLKDQVAPALVNSKIVLNASLQTRYKYAQYLIWRPYIYKVLHFPNSSTDEDFQGCAEAFKVCSFWPLTYPIFQDQRRLIPHLCEYSHTFFGILALLLVSLRSPALRAVLEPLPKHDGMELSKAHMLRWMRDMQVLHPVARWCWQLLRVLYKDHPVVKDLV